MKNRLFGRGGAVRLLLAMALYCVIGCTNGPSGKTPADGDAREQAEIGDERETEREAESGAETEAAHEDETPETLEGERAEEEMASEAETTPQDGDAERDTEPDFEPELSDTDSETPATGACASLTDCTGLEVCHLAYGVCEVRETWPGAPLAITALTPPQVASGDFLVLDGARYYSSLLGSMKVKVKIGQTDVTNSALGIDENRIVLGMKNALAGPVMVIGETGSTSFGAPLGSAPSGLIACDTTTPAASGQAGKTPAEHGPYAAGFVDFPAQELRLTYPAACGGLRRPAVPGLYPFVVILHGDGGIFLNYEYLAQHLASWGFISIMPAEDTMPSSGGYLESSKPLQTIVNTYRGQALGALHPALAGLTTTSEMALVGHSRGTARLEFLTQQDDMLHATLASVFLGPVDEGLEVTQGAFMTFSATNDRQSSLANSSDAYARQAAPKWHIRLQGGNHSLFTDYKTWSGALSDLKPTITRREQFTVVAEFVLPLFQRVFKKDEPFAAWLDAPPGSPLYTVTH